MTRNDDVVTVEANAYSADIHVGAEALNINRGTGFIKTAMIIV